jgi:uncharacterized protein
MSTAHADATAPEGVAQAPMSSGNDTARYFVWAYLLTWVPLLPPTLAKLGFLPGPVEQYMVLAPLAVFAPAIAALIASRREGGREGMRALLRGLRAWRVSPVWYLAALTLPGLVFLAGRGVYALIPGNAGGPWIYPATTAQQIAAMILVPIGEEIGWRGYALPRLQRRYGALRATAILGALWGVWHLPMFLTVGMTATMLLVMVPFFLAGNVMFTWFYNRTRGSLLLAVLLHVGTHLDNPHHALPGDITPLLIYTAAYVVVAALLLLVDRRAFDGSLRADR